MPQASKEARKLLNEAIEKLDSKLWHDIKKVHGYNDKRARREDLISQVDVMEKLRKQLNQLLQVETTDDGK